VVVAYREAVEVRAWCAHGEKKIGHAMPMRVHRERDPDLRLHKVVNERHIVFTRAALAMRGYIHHRVSVCVCDTRRYCIKRAKRRITQTTPRDSPETLVF